MDIKVYYHTMTNNTAKVANAIAQEVGGKANLIGANTAAVEADLLFVGDGCYGGKMHKDTLNFLLRLDPSKVHHIALFGTYGGEEKAILDAKARCESLHLQVMKNTFGCKGKTFFFINRKHPTIDELQAARAFAQAQIAQIEK